MNHIQGVPTVPSRNAALHAAVRPVWSDEVVSWLLGTPLQGRRLAVLDLGAGTGLGTRTIATLGHSVTAVDPDAAMLAVLDGIRAGLAPEAADRIDAAVGSAERIPLADHSVDAIVCLQAWHWADPERAMAECDRVLKHCSMTGLAWHTWDRTSAWVKALTAIVEPDGAPANQTRSVPAELADRGSFERRDFPFTYERPVHQLVDLASSWAFVAQRPDQDTVLTGIRHLGEQTKSPDTGLVSFPHITAAFRLQRDTALSKH